MTVRRLAVCWIVVTTIAAGAIAMTADKRELDNSVAEPSNIENGTTPLEERSALEILQKTFFDLMNYEDNTLQESGVESGRTFGVKRLQFMLMPMMYKMGVMMTLLVVLTVISLKGLSIGVILLVLKIGAIFGKFYAQNPSHGWPGQHQPVHLHLHNAVGPSPHYHQPNNGWESAYSGYAENQQLY